MIFIPRFKTDKGKAVPMYVIKAHGTVEV